MFSGQLTTPDRFSYHTGSVLPVLVSIAFSTSTSISRCFAIGFHSCSFFTTHVSAPIRLTFHLMMVRLGTGSGIRCCGPRGGGCHDKRFTTKGSTTKCSRKKGSRKKVHRRKVHKDSIEIDFPDGNNACFTAIETG